MIIKKKYTMPKAEELSEENPSVQPETAEIQGSNKNDGVVPHTASDGKNPTEEQAAADVNKQEPEKRSAAPQNAEASVKEPQKTTNETDAKKEKPEQQAKENPKKEQIVEEDKKTTSEKEATEEPKEEPKPEKPRRKPRTKKVDLDISLDDIKFEQRTERREGTRRRGYRRTQDRNLVSRAQQDAMSIKESAKLDGYNEGIANAKKDLDELKEKLSEFYKLKDEVFNKVAGCIYDISLEMAKKILNKEPETSKEYLIPIIKEVIEEINKTENKIILKVMPKDVEIVKDKLPEIFHGSGIEASISVAPDKNIKDGGVIVETSNGIIDATIETRMAIMEKTILNAKGVS